MCCNAITENELLQLSHRSTGQYCSKLIKTTRKAPESHQLTGEQRAFLYLAAANTGFRASELYSLTPASFQFGEAPYIRLEGKAAKDKKTVNQPIPKHFADMIRPWLPKEGRLWTRLACKRAGEMIGKDLDKAKIARENKQGIVDFHSLRGFYVTELCKSIRNPKIIQTLARHSTMELTMKIYAEVKPSDAATAVSEVHIGTKKLNNRETSGNKKKRRSRRKAFANKAL